MPIDADIPEQYRGGFSIAVVNADGKALPVPGWADRPAARNPDHLLVLPDGKRYRTVELPILLDICGISQVAVDQILTILNDCIASSSTPMKPLDRRAIFRGLAQK